MTLELADYDFDLPEHLIAQQPADKRTASRLLVLQSGADAIHQRFHQLPDWLCDGDLLILNNTRVYPARLFGAKETGGRVELLVERVLDGRQALCFIKASKTPRPGSQILFGDNGDHCIVHGRRSELFEVEFSLPTSLTEYLEQAGSLPLPPYIKRQPDASDRQRYQTVFAERSGAIAAPTAGLHFDQQLLQQCRDRGVECACVTLHVGAGTFQPLRSEQIAAQRLHRERIEVTPSVCEQVAATRARGGRVVAVGTTVVRALESAARSGELLPFDGETELFLKPGDRFHVVDALVTNFHLPRSSLLLLVCAFAGRDLVLNGYRTAVSSEYRFFSYGDAMLLFRAERES